jgi:alpha-L-arabinofuranosidase
MITQSGHLRVLLYSFIAMGLLTTLGSQAQPENPPALPRLHIIATEVTGQVSPTFYGLMTEEINYSYEGGIYGELIRNRTFKASPTEPLFWSGLGSATLSLDTNTPYNAALNTCLKLDATGATAKTPAGVANGGFWGIPIQPKTTYHVTFFAKASPGFAGSLTVALTSANGQTVYASGFVSELSPDWAAYTVTLTTKDVPTTKAANFTITTTTPGTLWLQQVSLFPPTYQNHANGNRPDLMSLMADLHPKFLRFPGGNYLEGDYFNERFQWKQTVGPIEQRPGHRSPWNYWSTDGFGLPEFLNWCEELKMEPVLAVFAGYSLKKDYAAAGPELEPYVQEALDEIEYVTGDAATTKWGAQRAKDGHPAPFVLHYVEIGNEDFSDKSGSYDRRFAQFYDAIKAKYPEIQVIATTRVKSREPDLLDEHFYRSEEEMELHALDYDSYPRASRTKIFVGEWATRVGWPTPNMAGALGDAAWMTGMERNADIVRLHCYAPLLVNISDIGKNGSIQWKTDLIGYDALNSFGSPSYYVQKIFSTQHGDEVLATHSEHIPTQEWQPPAPRKRNGQDQPLPPKQIIRKLFYSVTRDHQSGLIYLKVVNSQATAQPLSVEIDGVDQIADHGTATVLKAERLEDSNSLRRPQAIIPHDETVTGLGKTFTRTFPPYSITILKLTAK